MKETRRPAHTVAIVRWPHASIDDVYRIADLVPKHFRSLVLLPAFSALRWSELIALRRRDLDLEQMLVHVSRSVARLQDGQVSIGPTKSPSGVRTAALPMFLAEELSTHLADFAEAAGTGSCLSASVRGCRSWQLPSGDSVHYDGG